MIRLALNAPETWTLIQCPHAAEPMLALCMLLGICGHRVTMTICTDVLPRDWYRPRDRQMTWPELDAAVERLTQCST